MSQGLFVREPNPVGQQLGFRRPKSKKEVKELVKDGHLDCVRAEATSIFGQEYNGPLDAAPAGTITVVGPDPYVKRTWYATITVAADGTVKIK